MKSKNLLTTHPEIAKEWDYSLNKDLTPMTATKGMTKKVNWICPNGHQYTARIDHRCSMHSGCPICANKQPLAGVNDLQTVFPEIAQEWDFSANALSPQQFLPFSNKVASWICPICGRSYKKKIIDRTCKKSACPSCIGERCTSHQEQALYFYLSKATETINRVQIDQKVEIDLFLPELAVGVEYNGEYYHTNRQDKDIKKLLYINSLGIEMIIITCGRARSVSRTSIILETAPMANPTDAELKWGIEQLFHLLNLPVPDIDLRRDAAAIYSQYVLMTKQNSLAAKYPELAKQWDYAGNKGLHPEAFSPGSHKRVWWICPECSSSYDMVISNRTIGNSNCPYCAGKRIKPGFNDICATHPSLILEWDYDRNTRKPEQYSKGSDHKAHWKCTKCGHRWQATISSRTQGCGCPVCAGRSVKQGYNDLGTLFPEVAKLWNYDMNDGKLPCDFTAHSNQKTWWKCDQCGHNWKASINMIVRGRRCPECAKTNRVKNRGKQ